jgi:hypothetical protein
MRPLFVALVLSLVVRWTIAHHAPILIDTRNFEITGRIVASGGNLYAEQWAYNYAPTIGYLAGGIVVISVITDVPFPTLWRGTLASFDLVNVVLVYSIARRRKRLLTWLYAFNPATLLATAWWGQFDLIALIPIFAACYYWSLWSPRRSSSSTSRSGLSGDCLCAPSGDAEPR